MTPLQFAASECSNFSPPGICRGLEFEDTGRVWRNKEKAGKDCLLRERHPCAFFHEIVLPLAKMRADRDKGGTPFEQVVKEYRKMERDDVHK